MQPLTGRLEFQQPTALHAYDYDGEMYYSTNGAVNFALTPNHRMYVRRWNERLRTLSDRYDFCEIGKIGWYSGLPHATTGYYGTEINSVVVGRNKYCGDDFLALVALIISDGWAGTTQNTHNRVSFCCFRDDRYPMVAALAAHLGITEQPGRRGVWTWSDPELAEW